MYWNLFWDSEIDKNDHQILKWKKDELLLVNKCTDLYVRFKYNLKKLLLQLKV